jgi:putative transcriptional regulator
MESELVIVAPIVNRVKELRLAHGWTQQQLADAVGVSRQSINSIERNRYVPSLELALTFARVFGCATDDIFTLEIHS